MSPVYQVIAPMVVAQSNTPSGPKLQNFYKDARLPADVPQKQIERFLRRRMIVEIDEQGVPVAAAPADTADPPAKPAGRGSKTG